MTIDFESGFCDCCEKYTENGLSISDEYGLICTDCDYEPFFYDE